MAVTIPNYDPTGAKGGEFAPAYIANYQPSVDAVAKWDANRFQVTPSMLPSLAMPNAWQGPTAYNPTLAPGNRSTTTYGPEVGGSLQDVAALTAMAQGGNYDVQGRRNAIAAQLAANNAAADSYTQQSVARYGSVPDVNATGVIYNPADRATQLAANARYGAAQSAQAGQYPNKTYTNPGLVPFIPGQVGWLSDPTNSFWYADMGTGAAAAPAAPAPSGGGGSGLPGTTDSSGRTIIGYDDYFQPVYG